MRNNKRKAGHTRPAFLLFKDSTTNNLYHSFLYQPNMKPASEIKSELIQFSGTTQYYRHLLGVLYTDGIKYLAESCQCYWLLDLIVSWQAHSKVRKHEFQVFKLRVDERNRTAVVTIEDGNNHIIETQKIPFTDFPLDSIDIWYSNKVMYLPSEH